MSRSVHTTSRSSWLSQAWALYRQDTLEGFAAAIPYLEKAVKLDPDYGRTYAALASIYYRARIRGWNKRLIPSTDLVSSNSMILREAFANQLKAMENPTPFAHAVASGIHVNNGQHDEAIAQAERAISLDPNDPAGHVAIAQALTMAGRPQEAVAFVERAMRLDPHYPPSYLWVRGLAYFGMEEFKKAGKMFEDSLERSPDLIEPSLAATYGHLGREEDARAILKDVEAWYHQRWGPGYPFTVRSIMWWYRYKEPADAKRFADGLRTAGLK